MRNSLKFLAPLTIASLLLTGAGCLTQPPQIKPVTLEYWRIEDSETALAETIAAYQKLHPNVTINVRKMRTEDYERTLREAFASNRAPDLFSIPNTWLGAWRPNILPMPTKTTIVTPTVRDGKVVNANVETPAMSLVNFNTMFVEGISRSLTGPVFEGGSVTPVTRILGLPFSADTLGLYYNRDILRRANIEKPPTTWREVQEQAVKLTVYEALEPDETGSTFGQVQRIRQSGAALGLASNVNHYTDILATIMGQNGANLADENGSIQFSLAGADRQAAILPGAEALQFYQSFAIPGSQNFAWDANQPNSLDAFIAGTSAFYFGFPYEAAVIRERAPRLDFGIGPMPQVDPSRPFSVLHHPVEVVSRTAADPANPEKDDIAWDFLQFAAQPDNVRPFLTATKRPTALRVLIDGQLSDAEVAPFAGQVLNARGWYKGVRYDKVEAAFQTMIETYPTFERPDYQPIVAAGAAAVAQTMSQ